MFAENKNLYEKKVKNAVRKMDNQIICIITTDRIIIFSEYKESKTKLVFPLRVKEKKKKNKFRPPPPFYFYV